MIIHNLLIAIFWCIFCIYWIIAAIRTKGHGGKIFQPKGFIFRIILVIIAIIIFELPAFQTFSTYYGRMFSDPTVNSFGVIFCAMGLVFAVWARKHLGNNWGMPMTIKKESELITSGPYQFVRHPIYSGMLFAALGSMLVGDSFWLLFFVLLAIYFVYSSGIEDNIMAEKFPQVYSDYKKRTKAFIPFIF